jgi:hypothetical protein
MEYINQRNIKYIALAILFACVLTTYCKQIEGFSDDMRTFVPVGEQRYGLRGNLLRTRPRTDYYIRPDRHIRLSDSGAEMYESNYSPVEEGATGCVRVQCPRLNDSTPEVWSGYDEQDQCWNCK